MNRLDSITMRDLLPPNFKYDPDAIAASAAVATEYHRLCDLAGQAVVLAGIDNLAEQWLDLLAVDMHVDYYDATLPVGKKRELIKQSIPMHQKKGTPWAVEEMIRIVFGDGRVEEWWEYGGEPYHFKVHTSTQFATQENERQFHAALSSAKNLRSVLESIVVTLNSAGTAYAGSVMQETTVDTITITGEVGDMSPPPIEKYTAGFYFESVSETHIITA